MLIFYRRDNYIQDIVNEKYLEYTHGYSNKYI